MADQTSALQEHLSPGRFERGSSIGVALTEIREFDLIQIAAWPDTVEAVGTQAARMAGCTSAPEPGRAESGDVATLLRVEPLKWWMVVKAELRGDFGGCDGTVLDLTHSRTRLRLSGPWSATLLNHYLPLDLRDAPFPVGSVASSAIHHVGVTLWRDAQGFELLIPRSFAASVWQLLFHSAQQYGVEVMSAN